MWVGSPDARPASGGARVMRRRNAPRLTVSHWRQFSPAGGRAVAADSSVRVVRWGEVGSFGGCLQGLPMMAARITWAVNLAVAGQ